MGQSERVRAGDELAVVRLVNECRELGDDAAAWQALLVAGLLGLTGGMVAAVGAAPPHRAGGLDRYGEWAAGHSGGGWPSAAVRDRWVGLAADPGRLAEHPGLAAFLARPEPDLTATRRGLVADRAWDRSGYVNEVLRADGFDEGLASRVSAPAAGAAYVLSVMRAAGDRPFGPRVGRVVARLQAELAPHLGRGLWLTTEPNVAGLPPRLRQVLGCLLDGDGEKHVAARLGLHPTTVHDHVKRLYRHFGVSSRPELMARWVKRGWGGRFARADDPV